MKYLKFAVAGFSLLLILQTSAFSHHLWITESDKNFSVQRGHAPDKIQPYKTECITFLKSLDSEGKELGISRINGKDKVNFTVTGDPELVTATAEWGGRVNTPEGKKLISKEEALKKGLTVTSSFDSIQYTKTFFKYGKLWNESAVLKFEIVPLTSHNMLKQIGSIKIQILFEGKPLADCKIYTDSKKSENRTDKNGYLTLKIEKKGIQVITAIHEVPSKNNTEIDYLQLMSFLVFNIQ